MEQGWFYFKKYTVETSVGKNWALKGFDKSQIKL